MAFKTTVESFEQEQARLAEAPEGSKAHFWSTLPQTVTGSPEGLALRLPTMFPEKGRIVVVPLTYTETSPRTPRAEGEPVRRRDGSWDCIVIASTDKRYAVGGWHLSIPHVELIRSEIVEVQA